MATSKGKKPQSHPGKGKAGSRAASWKQGKNESVDHHLILTEAVKHVHVDKQGVWYTWGLNDFLVLLTRLISFHNEIPDSAKLDIVSKALGECAKQGPITDVSLIEEIDKLSRTFLTRPRKKFLFVTSISIAYGTFWFSKFAKARVIRGNRITLTPEVRSELDWDAVKLEGEHFTLAPEPADYTFIATTIKGRTNQEAVDSAVERIDLLRGIWNFALNKGQREFLTGGGPRPANKIIRGPFSKLYDVESGKPKPTDGLWTNDSYGMPPIRPVDLNRAWESMVKTETKIRRELLRSPFRDRVEQWIRDYGRALDLQSPDLAYLSLWRTIEQMCGIGPNERHTEIVKRVSFLYGRLDFNRMVLTLLRELRNEAVHVGNEMTNARDHLDALRMYVEVLLSFYIFNPYDFASVSEVVEFFRLPPDLGQLEHEIRIRKKALKFRSGPPKSRKKKKPNS